MKVKVIYFLVLFFIFTPIYLFRLYAKLDFPFKEGDKVRIAGLLVQEPLVKGERQSFKLKGVYISFFGSSELHYGDYLEVIGVVEKSEGDSFLNQFYLSSPQVKKIDSLRMDGYNILKAVFKLRERLERVINQVLPEPQAGLLNGIFLGVQKRMSDDFYQQLKTSGTLHIIVASGMNISLIAGVLGDFLSRFLKRKPALIVSLVCILIYCVMAGMNPPIIRAGLMAAVLYLANFTGREGTGLWVLVLTGVIMLLIKPLLLFDLGFQLSFSATAGLITLGPLLQRFFSKVKLIGLVAGDLGETLSAMVFTLPILIISFGHFNPLSIIPNLLILWLIPYLMYLGLLISIIGLFFGALAQFLGWLVWIPLTYLVWVIKVFGKLELFDLRLENISWIFGMGYYLIVFSLLKNRKRFKKGLIKGER